jgi:hypothetical protein
MTISSRTRVTGRLQKPTLIAILAVLTTSIAILGLMPGSKQTILADQIQGLGHFVFFGALAFVMAVALPAVIPRWQRHARWQYLWGGGIAVALGAMLETAQRFIPSRNGNWIDLWQDALGAVAAMALLATLDSISAEQRRRRPFPWSAVIVLCVCLTLGIIPLVRCSWDYWQRMQQFPVLLQFSQAWGERFLWQDPTVTCDAQLAPPEWPSATRQNTVHVLIGTGERYPGFGIREPYPDWRAFDWLVFELWNNEPDDVSLVLRIHDQAHTEKFHDRFNRKLSFAPGFHSIRISLRDIQAGPRSRPLDLAHVDGLRLFAIDPKQPIELWFGNAHLE